MAEDNKVIRHWIGGIGRLQPIAQLHRFAERGFGDVDMINVGSFTGSRWCPALCTCYRFWSVLRVNEWDK
jgi:hypothetical protein